MFTNILTKLTMLLYLLCIILAFSCQSSNDTASEYYVEQHINTHEKADPSISDDKSATDTGSWIYAEYAPLTLDKLQAIREGTDEFKQISIYYSCNPGRQGPGYRSSLNLRAGLFFKVHDYSMISEFKGSLVDFEFATSQFANFEETFKKAEVDSILDHIENYPAFFFNHEEFDGADVILSPGEGIGDTCNHNFTVTIVKPDIVPMAQYLYTWGISKCIDEYPVPDHPLYGLFQILENDFISQFE